MNHHVSPSHSPRATARNYDRMSGWYDLLSGPAESRLRQAGLKRLALQPGERLLEIGPGTGTSLVSAARQVSPAGQVVGVDLSYGMCRVTHERLQRELEHQTPAAVIQGDALRLPFRGSCFEACFFSFTFELFPRSAFPQVLAEIRRVSSPASRLGVVSLVKTEPQPWMARAYTWLHKRFPATLDCRPIDLEQILTQNGYSPISYEEQMLFGLPVALVVCK